jgi:spermidine synthase
VGLGVGSVLSYAEPGQRWTVYEIDPKVAAIAANPRYFTYLAEAKAPFAVVLGDARRSLSRTEERYSLILLDAYSSDAVPIHLLTREAFEVYLSRLEEGGLIAAHISNKHLDLGPVAFGISEALGLVCREQNVTVSPSAEAEGKRPSHWVILARRREDLGALGEDPRWSEASPGKRVIWTDDFSSLWSIWRGE